MWEDEWFFSLKKGSLKKKKKKERLLQEMGLAVCVLSQSCPTCDHTECSPSGSSVHRIFRQEYWSGLPLPSPGDLPSPGIESTSLTSPALAGRFFSAEPPGWPHNFSLAYHLRQHAAFIKGESQCFFFFIFHFISANCPTTLWLFCKC